MRCSSIFFDHKEEQLIHERLLSYSFRVAISVVVTTFNRCPAENPILNPLIWCLQTLSEEAHGIIDEFIIIDDASSDYTKESVGWFKSNYDFRVKYMRQDERKGCSYSRNKGLAKAANNIVFFTDDDCLFKPGALAGSVLSFMEVGAHQGPVAILNLPVYDRDTIPLRYESINRIGKRDFDNCWFYHNFDTFPKEYGSFRSLTNGELTPSFEVQTFKGVTLASKEAILDVGGFLDLSMWETDYSEHIELSYELSKSGYKMFHLPDPRVGVLHLQFGSPTAKTTQIDIDQCREFQGLSISMQEVFTISGLEYDSTGCRVSDEVFHENEIGTFFAFYLKLSEEHAIRFALKEHKNFVIDMKTFTNLTNKIPRKDYRQEIWEKALWRGLSYARNQNGNVQLTEDTLKTLIVNCRKAVKL